MATTIVGTSLSWSTILIMIPGGGTTSSSNLDESPTTLTLMNISMEKLHSGTTKRDYLMGSIISSASRII